jgi:nucleoside-diphosphate-sugar epimerase
MASSPSSAQLVILGGCGFVARRFLAEVLKQHPPGSSGFAVSKELSVPLKSITLVDIRGSLDDFGTEVMRDGRVGFTAGDLCDEKFIASAIGRKEAAQHIVVVHLAALLSGNSEQNFDLAMQVNLYSPLKVMERMRSIGTEGDGILPVYLFISSDYVFCFNEFNRTHLCNEESFRLSPVSSGCQKACVEIMVCDYTRKGFINGRVARLGGVIGRPEFSNSISYPWTGVFTQTLAGKDYAIPPELFKGGRLSMADLFLPCSSLNNNVAGILHCCTDLDSTKLGHNRVIQVPTRSWSLQEIWDTTQKLYNETDLGAKLREHGIDKLGRVVLPSQDSPSEVSTATSPGGDAKPTVKELNVCPKQDINKAVEFGLPNDVSLETIIREFVGNHILVISPVN